MNMVVMGLGQKLDGHNITGVSLLLFTCNLQTFLDTGIQTKEQEQR